MKKKIIIGIILVVVIGVVSFGGYKYYRYSKSNELLKESAILMKEGNFNGAEEKISTAKKLDSKNTNIENYEENLKYDKEAQIVFNKGVELQKEGKLDEAIKVLSEINPKAIEVKENADNLIAKLKEELINSYIEKAKTNISKGAFTEANKNIEDISKIDSSNKNIDLLRKEEAAKKESLIKSYVDKAKTSLKSNDFQQAETNINNISKIDKNNKNIGSLNQELKEKVKNEKYYNNTYRGLGNKITVSTHYSPYMGTVTLMTSEYNPNVINNQSFIEFYNSKIKPNLKQGVIYDLININKPGTGLIFAGAANENDEFNKGSITSSPEYLKGTLDINNPNAQYCGIHGNNIVSYMLSNHEPVKFTFN